MPTDLFGWFTAIYWPLCFAGAVVLTLVFVKKPVTRVLLTLGFAMLALVMLCQRVFWIVAFPGDGEMRIPSELLAASTAVFGIGDLIGYGLIFVGLVLPARKVMREPSTPSAGASTQPQ